MLSKSTYPLHRSVDDLEIFCIHKAITVRAGLADSLNFSPAVIETADDPHFLALIQSADNLRIGIDINSHIELKRYDNRE